MRLAPQLARGVGRTTPESYDYGAAAEPTMISTPILHDIIKSELHHNARTIFEQCKSINSLKQSNLFKKEYWKFREARQEQFNARYYQADAVWYFQGQNNDNYYIVHEVKTGNYSVLDIYNKYHTGMSGQIWIWGWKEQNNKHIFGKEYQRKIRVVDIESLIPILSQDINRILVGLAA